MMKIIKRIVAWVMISLLLQFAGLFYLDKFYFISENKFVEKTPKQVPKKIEKVDIPIPESAKNVSVSYDGKYAAYYEGEELKVIDTQSAAVKSVQFEEGIKVSFYKWLPDRDRMIIAEKKGNGLSFSSYDVKKNEKIEVKDELNNTKAYIQLPDKKSEVADMVLSTLTNMIYVKVTHAGSRNSVYSINIMAQMQKVNTTSYVMGDIGIAPHGSNLIYEDLTYNKVHVTGIANSLAIKGAAKTSLIGIDEEDNLYLGQVEKDGIRKLVYGSLKDNIDQWTTVELNDTPQKKDMYVSAQGKVYINDDLKGVTKDVKTGKETPYIGSFLQMYGDGVASISEQKLIKTTFN